MRGSPLDRYASKLSLIIIACVLQRNSLFCVCRHEVIIYFDKAKLTCIWLTQIHIFIDVKKVLNCLIRHIVSGLNFELEVCACSVFFLCFVSNYEIFSWWKSKDKFVINIKIIQALHIWNETVIGISNWLANLCICTGEKDNQCNNNGKRRAKGKENNMTKEFFRKWIAFYGDYLFILVCAIIHHLICSFLHSGAILCLLTNCACPI